MFKRAKVLDRALRRRVAVNFLDSAATFTGRLVAYDAETYVLEACETVASPGETPQPIAGRQYVDRIHCWMQELST